MAKDNKMLIPTPSNETVSPDPNSPDISGGGLYATYDEVMSAHLQPGCPFGDSPNGMDGGGIFGGPAAGEPNPAGVSTDGSDRKS